MAEIIKNFNEYKSDKSIGERDNFSREEKKAEEPVKGEIFDNRDRSENDITRDFNSLWKKIRNPIIDRDNLSAERNERLFCEAAMQEHAFSKDGPYSLQMRESGHVYVADRETGETEHLHIDFKTGKVEYDSPTPSAMARFTGSFYETVNFKRDMAFVVPERSEIRGELERAMKELEKTDKTTLNIGNTKYELQKDYSGEFSINTDERVRDERVFVLDKKNMSKEEMLSEKNIEDIEKSAGAAYLMRCLYYAEHPKGEVVRSDPDQYVTREGENKYKVNDLDRESMTTTSEAMAHDYSDEIDNTREINNTVIGAHDDDDERDEDDPYGERSLF